MEVKKKGMTLNEYQKRAMTTCMPSCENFSYMLLNLVGEVGELASKVAKAIRKEQTSIGLEPHLTEQFVIEGDVANNLWMFPPGDTERIVEMMLEAGDVLWQLSGLCSVMGWTLEDVGQKNLDKLAARKKAGTIDGSGDGIIRGK